MTDLKPQIQESQRPSRRKHTKKSTPKSIKNTDNFFKSHGDKRESFGRTSEK